MADLPPLTAGATANLVSGASAGPVIVQILGIKRMTNAGVQQDRFRVLLSDGEYSTGCILATQLGDMVSSNAIVDNSIVRLDDYINNQVQDKKVTIVLSITVLAKDAPRIGSPRNYEKVFGAAAGAPPPGGPPPMQQQAPPPAPGGYGAPPPAAGGYGGPAPGGYGGGAPGGGYGGPPPGAAPGGPNPYGPPSGAPGGYGAPGGAPGGAYGAPPAGAPYGGAPGGQQRAPGNPYGQQQGGPQYRGTGPVARNEAPAHIMPINALNSYQNRWTIKARVTNKSDIRRYNNARGEGRFFSFDLLDAQGGEIRVVAWNDQCDRWEPQVEQGKVYLISKASLRNKRGNFNQLRHAYEIHLETASQVELCPDEEDIPFLYFNFVKLSTVEDTPPNNTVDVVAVVESCNDWVPLTKRDGTETQKRSMVVRDDSQRSIELTLWGASATGSPGDQIQAALAAGHHPVLAIKNARVGDFNGKTLSTVGSSTVVMDPPEVPEAVALRQWWDQGGAAAPAEALSRQGGGPRSDRRITLAQIKEDGLGLGEKPDWVMASCAITYLRSENMSYPSCPNKIDGGRQCNKKLQDQQNDGNTTWCERCQAHFEPEHRYILSLTMSDHTGEAWVTAFQESGVDVLGGRTAAEMMNLRNDSEAEFSSYMQDRTFRHYLAKLKISSEVYQDEQKVRTTLVAVTPPNYATESRVLLDSIAKLERGEDPFAPPQPAGQQQQQQGGWGQQGYKAQTPQRGGAQGWGQQNQPMNGGGGGYGQQGGGYGGLPAGGYGGAPAGGYGGAPQGGGNWGQQQQQPYGGGGYQGGGGGGGW